ncbi:hypothetical protein LZK98_03145 [Sphingomonas cannabina]|nr:hypothetical protein LZK98_03145 [Sphingomonas cannabina]
MKMVGILSIGLAIALAGAGDAGAQRHRRGDQDAAREAREQGRLLSLREIERRVVPKMKGAQYIGFDFDSGTQVYTLKFLRDGNVIWVSVDGRSGAVIGRTGS